MNSCGEVQLLKEECDVFSTCVQGECAPCETNEQAVCDEGKLVVMDLCGNIVEEVETCGADSICVDGKCIASENAIAFSDAIHFPSTQMESAPQVSTSSTMLPQRSITTSLPSSQTACSFVSQGAHSP